MDTASTYSIQGETLDAAAIEALRRYFHQQRGDGISIVLNAERGLRQLGDQVPSAIRPRSERQHTEILTEDNT